MTNDEVGGASAFTADQVRHIVDTAVNPFVVIDYEGNALWASESVVELLGVTADELVGRSMLDVVSPDSFEAAALALASAAGEDRAPGAVPAEWEGVGPVLDLVRADGATITCSISVATPARTGLRCFVLQLRRADPSHALEVALLAMGTDRPLGDVLDGVAAVLRGEAGPQLVESYDIERRQAADENIGHSTRSTDFIAPRSAAERTWRDAVLSLAPAVEFARRMVNSGRLSVASVYDSPLSTPDVDVFGGNARLGAPAPDAPVRIDNRTGILLEQFAGEFQLLRIRNGATAPPPRALRVHDVGDTIHDQAGLLSRRYDASPGATYLIRPDQHLCARWRRYEERDVRAALRRALGH